MTLRDPCHRTAGELTGPSFVTRIYFHHFRSITPGQTVCTLEGSMTKKAKVTKWFFFIFLGLVILADRTLWATVSQWREDQSTDMWLGFTQNILSIPVGLISSARIPNPNGMVIIGYFLSWLPNMLAISVLLSCLQVVLIFAICRVSFKSRPLLFFILCAPLLTSIVLRGTSEEFWSQWLLTSANLSFLLWAVLYQRKPTLASLPVLVGLIMLGPALYLAGLVNALVMSGIGIGLIVIFPPEDWRKNWWKAMAGSLGVIAIALWLVWLPYFRAVGMNPILTISSHESLSAKLLEMIYAIIRFPYWGTFLATNSASFVIHQNSDRILSNLTVQFIDLTRYLQLFQSILTFAILLYALIRYLVNLKRKSENSTPDVKLNVKPLVILSAAYLLASYALSPLLGGAIWSMGERPDQTVQFLPFLIIFWFLTPFAVPLPKYLSKVVITITIINVAFFAATSFIGGLLVVQSHLDYRGDFLSSADVPLIQKMQVVDFIAADWKSISNSTTIPVDYYFGNGRWSGITRFGHQLDPWYNSPYTLGRGYDYDLLRRYGLKNLQEGVQDRTFGTGRYLVTYAFQPAPNQLAYPMTNYIFGRLRVSVVNFPVGQNSFPGHLANNTNGLIQRLPDQ